MTSDALLRLRDRALEELNAHDAEGHRVARLDYRHIQALKQNRWPDVIEEIDRQTRRTVRGLWLMAAFLVLAAAGSVLYHVYAVGGTALPGSEVISNLLVPGLCIAYGVYAVRTTTERVQHLERARVLLETVREEEQIAREDAPSEAATARAPGAVAQGA
jgi:hypothetical protein